MGNNNLNWIANFIWGIADDVLRDVYVRGKYRDVILPMVVIRRLDAVLEPTKQAVLTMTENLDKAGIANQDAALRNAAGQAFTTRLRSPCETFALVPKPSNSRRILKPTSMVSLPTSRRSSTSSSCVTRFLLLSRPTSLVV